MRAISLFSGIGGFESGLEKSYLDVEVVFSSEIDSHARQSYKAIWGEEPQGDITQIKETEIPAHNLLIAGFPCQAFSIAGKREGFDDTRGTLFFEVARILKYHKPEWIILENVKNLVSHDEGNTFKRMLEILNEIGYAVDFEILNSKNYRTAQSRERIYIVGRYIKKDKFEKEYEINAEAPKRIIALKTELNKIETRKKINFFKNVKTSKTIRTIRQILENEVDDTYYYVDYPEEELRYIEEKDKNEIVKLNTVSKDIIRDNDRQRRIYSPYGVSPTLLARSDSPKIQIKDKVRKLTEVEVLRIQGFPEHIIQKIKNAGTSRTQMYKQAGNAVSPNVIKEIANAIYKYDKKNNLKCIDLFSGIGGFRIAAENNGVECIMSSEIDEAARKQYEVNFGDVPLGDISIIEASEIPDHDLLLAGFPCQPFSIGGHRKGFDDTRGTLFFEVERILKHCMPSAILLENVGGILSHDDGNTIRVIREKLSEMYDIYELRANAKEYGIPQNRDRWYLVGFRKNLEIKIFDFPQRRKLRAFMYDFIMNDNTEALKISNIAKRNIKLNLEKKPGEWLIANEIRPSRCSFSNGEISPCLTAKMGTGGNNVPVVINQNRKLTSRECLDIMGYPDDIILLPGNQAYKQVGNSIAVPLVTEIIGKIIEKLEE